MKEIYWNSTRDMMLLEDLSTNEVVRFDQLMHSFFKRFDSKIACDYPPQCAELNDLFPGVGREYQRVYQFCACNFSERDGQPDIDDDFNFILERVSCPVRHTCKRTTCQPQLTSDLSRREMEIIPLFVKYSEEEIADRLFISPNTVHNHINNIYTKLGIRGNSAPKQLVAYAYKNKLVT